MCVSIKFLFLCGIIMCMFFSVYADRVFLHTFLTSTIHHTHTHAHTHSRTHTRARTHTHEQADPKWKERKEVLELLLPVAQSPKISPGDFGELVKSLKKVS